MNIQRGFAIGVLCCASVVAVSYAAAAAEQSDKYSREDAADSSRSKVTNPEFVKKAGAAGMAEVDMGKLGAQKASSAEVKAFAQRMVTDHTKANNELAAAVKGKDLEIPSSPDLMHKAMREKFEHQGADKDFDHDFMQQMVKDHKAVVELFQNAAASADLDPELRALAKKTLPTLKEHLKDAQKLESQLAK
jgi:putative membrane protein